MGKAIEQRLPGTTSPSEQEESTWNDLSRVRDGWQEIEAEETRLLRQMTVQESLRQLLALQRAFEPYLQQTEALFRAERMAYLEELQRRLGTTMIYVTHDQVEAMTLGDRVAVLHQGRLQQVGTPRELYELPANAFVAGFIGSPPMNLFPAVVESASESGVSLRIGSGAVGVPAARLRGTRVRELAGRRITAGIRPEAVGVDTPGTGVTLHAKVEHVENLGHESLAYLCVPAGDAEGGAVRLVARLPGMAGLAPGESRVVRIDPGRLYLFDERGESLLR